MAENKVDHPAAHSMDTEWFAVDRDGHVGHFVSGEAGAVPDGAYLGEDYGPVLEAMARLADVGEKYVRPRGEGAAAAPHLPEPGPKHPWSMLVFADSAEAFGRAFGSSPVPAWKADDGVAFWFETVDAELHRRLHETKACQACVVHHGPDEDALPNPARRGLFSFEHATDNVVAGPYVAQRLPASPITVDELPRELREEVSKVRFANVSFAAAPSFQPAEHAPSQAWGAGYLDSSGKRIASLPGREAEFLEEYGPDSDGAALAREDGVEVVMPDAVAVKVSKAKRPGRRLLVFIGWFLAAMFAAGVLAAIFGRKG